MNESNSNFTNAIHLTASITSAVCLVVITLILLLLIFYKAYNSTLQRLLLYLTIFTVIQEVSMTAGYATEIEYNGHETVCDMINIVWEWSTIVGYLLTLAIIVFLPYKVYEQFKGDSFPRLSRSRCFHVVVECLFIFIVLLLPLIFVLPWASFGQAYMKSDDNCTKFNSVVVGIINTIDLFEWNFCDHNSTICCILLLGLQVQGNKSNTWSNTCLSGVLCCIYRNCTGTQHCNNIQV